ncbi:HU family DNA-binding protein [Dyella sp.]|uniref:HU family DNA-binding protein n=1 Tax=Dyella sp. TaxID=1869338 RepID=UPI002ED1E6F7
MNRSYALRKNELIEHLAATVDLPKRSVAAVLEALGMHVQRSLPQGNHVTLPGIGRLKTIIQLERCDDPDTGESAVAPTRVMVKFTATRALQEEIETGRYLSTALPQLSTCADPDDS